MRNDVTQYLAKYIHKNRISLWMIEEVLDIPKEKLIPGTKESLTGEECLKLCQFLHIRPEHIPVKFITFD